MRLENFSDKDINKMIDDWKITNDNKLLEKILNSNSLIINSLVNQYSHSKMIDKKDLIIEGMLGTLHAIKKYDSSKNIKFSTYAYFWIKAKILKAIKTIDNKTENYQDFFFYLQKDEIKHNIINENYDMYSKDLQDLEVERVVRSSLFSLNQREQKVIERRWLSNDNSFCKISKEMHLSEERVRQIEKTSFKKLRNILDAKYSTLKGSINFLWLKDLLEKIKNFFKNF